MKHVALVAVADEDGRPTLIGGGRYYVVEPGKAEIAFGLIDEYQAKGIGSALIRHMAAIGREAGLRELVAEVLSDGNRPPSRRLHMGLKPHAFAPTHQKEPLEDGNW